jgi:hypothetical protein
MNVPLFKGQTHESFRQTTTYSLGDICFRLGQVQLWVRTELDRDPKSCKSISWTCPKPHWTTTGPTNLNSPVRIKCWKTPYMITRVPQGYLSRWWPDNQKRYLFLINTNAQHWVTYLTFYALFASLSLNSHWFERQSTCMHSSPSIEMDSRWTDDSLIFYTVNLYPTVIFLDPERINMYYILVILITNK